MPVYYFHMRDGEDIILDPEGLVFASPAAIAAAALKAARDIIGHEAMAGLIDLDKRIDVEDDAGSVVYSLEFDDAVTIRRPG